MTQPTPQTLTLRLKHSHTTVLVHASALSSPHTLKATLLSALQSTGLSTRSGKPIPLPSDAAEIQLAQPRDPLDLGKGWEMAEWEEEGEFVVEGDDNEGERRKKGKGKAKEGEGKSLKAYGVRDGDVFAFRFGGGEGWQVEVARFEDGYGEGDGEGEMEG